MSENEKQFFESTSQCVAQPALNSHANLKMARRVLDDPESSEKKKQIARLLLKWNEVVKQEQKIRDVHSC